MAGALEHERERYLDVRRCQVREVIENLSLGHASGQVLKDVERRDPCASNAGFAGTDGRIDR